MKIAIGADHAGYQYKKELIKWLEEKSYQTEDFGCFSEESIDYPDFAYPSAEAVASGKADLGIIICGSGIGVSIVANKVKGIRAAQCFNPEMASLSRQHNNANVLTFGARFIDFEAAKEIIEAFLTAEFEGDRHQRRVDKIHSLTGV